LQHCRLEHVGVHFGALAGHDVLLCGVNTWYTCDLIRASPISASCSFFLHDKRTVCPSKNPYWGALYRHAVDAVLYTRKLDYIARRAGRCTPDTEERHAGGHGIRQVCTPPTAKLVLFTRGTYDKDAPGMRTHRALSYVLKNPRHYNLHYGRNCSTTYTCEARNRTETVTCPT
jgi:hypothetical protein